MTKLHEHVEGNVRNYREYLTKAEEDLAVVNSLPKYLRDLESDYIEFYYLNRPSFANPTKLERWFKINLQFYGEDSEDAATNAVGSLMKRGFAFGGFRQRSGERFQRTGDRKVGSSRLPVKVEVNGFGIPIGCKVETTEEWEKVQHVRVICEDTGEDYES